MLIDLPAMVTVTPRAPGVAPASIARSALISDALDTTTLETVIPSPNATSAGGANPLPEMVTVTVVPGVPPSGATAATDMPATTVSRFGAVTVALPSPGSKTRSRNPAVASAAAVMLTFRSVAETKVGVATEIPVPDTDTLVVGRNPVPAITASVITPPGAIVSGLM